MKSNLPAYTKACYLFKAAFLVVVLLFAGSFAHATTYYSAGNNAPNLLSSWWVGTNGTGTHPTNFTTAGNVFIIQNGHTMTTTAIWTVSGSGSTLQINNGGTLIASNAVAASVMTVAGGATYQHAQDGGTIPIATWNATSNCNITGITNSTLLTGLNQTFGNFTWNCLLQTTIVYLQSNMTIAGNFSVLGTGTTDPSNHSLRMSNSANGYTIAVTGNVIIDNSSTFKMNNSNGTCLMTIGGDFILAKGNFFIVTGDANSTVSVTGNVTISGGTLSMMEDNYSPIKVGTLNVGGNFSMSAGAINTSNTPINTSYGSIIFNKTGTQTYFKTGGTISNTINFTVNSGSTLDVGTSVINGSAGTFTLSSGAGIITAHTQGLSTTVGTGSIQVTGAKSYDTNANYTYDGTAAQVTGNGLAGANNLTINNSTGITLSGPVNAAGVTLISGKLATSLTNLLTITNISTTAISGYSLSNYIKGPLARTLAGISGNATYLFPIGDGTYNPLELVNFNSNGANAVFSVVVTDANCGGTAGTGMISLNTNRYWQGIIKIAGGILSSNLRLTDTSPIPGGSAVGNGAFLNGTYNKVSSSEPIGNTITADNLYGDLFFVIGTARSITTGTISGSSLCAGTAVSVPFTINTKGSGFTAGNVFTAQLSDASGSFASPVILGTLTSTVSGSVPGTIPIGTPAGAAYRIRVISSNPATTGKDNGNNLSVNTIPGAPSATGGMICIGSTAILTASGANTGESYNWYNVPSGGNALQSNTTNTYITPAITITTQYWVSILNPGGCESSRIQVTASYPETSPDSQTTAGTNSWIGYVYDGTNQGVAYNENFTNYFGYYNEPLETFDQQFGGTNSCFTLSSTLGSRQIYTESFSVRYRMNSTRKGLYIADMGSDDGSRLAVDGKMVYDNWKDQSWGSKPSVLMNLSGTSSLVYDFYENGGGNQATFQKLTMVLANNLITNTTQSLCIGTSGIAISGDVYGTLPTGITLSGTGYQWAYSTTSGGTYTDILGATAATYAPNSAAAPFNTAGTYYLIRKAVLSSSNNVSPSPYFATNESNVATITVKVLPVATFSYSGSPYCNNAVNPSPTFAVGGVAGTFSSAAGLVFVSTATGQVNLASSTAGTYTVTNTIAASGGCGVVTASSTFVVTRLPTALISYSGLPYYLSDPSQRNVSFTGTAGGEFTALPAGLTLNPATGAITPGTSTTGTYTITYTTGASGGCGTVMATTSIKILDIINISGSTGADGTYGSLTNTSGAFSAINGTAQTGNNVVITIAGNSMAETGVNSLNAGGWTSLNMYPIASGLTIGGNVGGKAMINLYGADDVTIDGRVNGIGTTKDLTISNTSIAITNNTSTIRFINDASNNTVKFCTIRGSGKRTLSGIIFFSSGTTTGNDNNNIENNNITNATDTDRPINAIYSSGTADFENSGNIISNNYIYDNLSTASNSYGIQLGSNTTDFTISGNSFYETTTLIPTGDFTYNAIKVNNPTGNNFIITGNYIGGQVAFCGGSPLTVNAATAHLFQGISLNVGTTTPSEIQNNTIQNFNYTTDSKKNSWQAIDINTGSVNIGTSAGNTIGAPTGTGSILVTGTITVINVYGISIAGTGTIDCRNNKIGAITTDNNTANASNFYGINNTSTGTANISNNMIGSLTSNNSINAVSKSTDYPQSVFGINNTGIGTLTINNNTIANLTNSTNNINIALAGHTTGISSTNGLNTITNNTIRDLIISNANNDVNQTASVCGIALSGSSLLKIISGNTIYNLSNTFDSFIGGVIGIHFTGNTTDPNLVSGNFIHSLTVTGANSTSANIYGIKIASGATTYYNNIINLGGTSSTTIYGFYETGLTDNANNLYFNTVYIGGSLGTGISNRSYALYSNTVANVRDFRNNILVNDRSTVDGANLHYPIYIKTVGGTLTIDNNDYVASGTGGLLGFYGGNRTTLSAWQTATSQDANSLNSSPLFIISGSTVATDYKIGTDLVGISGTGITLDYAGITRTNPTMGAWELGINKWKGTSSNDWNTAGNWTGNRIPGMNANIIFDNVPVNQCLMEADHQVTDISNAQATYRMVTNGHKLTVKGNFYFSNSAQIDASASFSTVEFAGNNTQSIPSGIFLNNRVYNLTLNNANNVVLNGTLRFLNAFNVVSGRLDANSKAPTVIYGGTSAQTMGGQYLGEILHNFTIDNPAGVTLTNDITLNGSLSLSNGIFSMDSQTLSFQDSDTPITRTLGTITTTANTSFVFGTPGNKGGSAFILPEGCFTSAPTINNLTINRINSLTFNDQMMSIKGILLSNGLLNTNNKLTLLSTSDQTALIDGTGTGNVLGNVKMQRYLQSGFGYKYVSSPFIAATIAEFATEVELNQNVLPLTAPPVPIFPNFYGYDEKNIFNDGSGAKFISGWVKYNFPSTIPLTLIRMAGYAANFGNDPAPKLVEVTGVVNNGAQTIPLSNSNSGGSNYTKGFNLVGNPYPSPIDWNLVTLSNVDKAIWLFNATYNPLKPDQYGGLYSSYIDGVYADNSANITSTPTIIPSMQGFFVRVTAPGSGTLSMTNSVRTTFLTPTFKAAVFDPRTILRFEANFDIMNSLSDACVLYFDPLASINFDSDKDAFKMMNTDIMTPNLYTITPNAHRLSINGMPEPVDSITRVPLGIMTLSDGWINFNVKDIGMLQDKMYIYLADSESDVVQDLKLNPEYRFYLKEGEYNNRFSLAFSLSDLLQIKDNTEKMFTLTGSSNLLTVIVDLPFNKKGTLMVTNLLGQVLFQKTVFEMETVEINPIGSSNVYIVTLITRQRKESQKILMRKN